MIILIILLVLLAPVICMGLGIAGLLLLTAWPIVKYVAIFMLPPIVVGVVIGMIIKKGDEE